MSEIRNNNFFFKFVITNSKIRYNEYSLQRILKFVIANSKIRYNKF